MDDHHTLVKKLGQQICTLRDPLCRRCPLHNICPTGLRNAPGATDSVLPAQPLNAMRVATD